MRGGRDLNKNGGQVVESSGGSAGTEVGTEESVGGDEGGIWRLAEDSVELEREATAFLTELSFVQTGRGREREEFLSERTSASNRFSR